jgi:integrase
MPFRTQTAVDGFRLPKGKTEHWEFDAKTTGLSVRLQGRRKAYVVWLPAGPDGKRRRLTLGDCAGMKLEQARQQATTLVHRARAGDDPVAERRAARDTAAAREADCLERLIASYLERHGPSLRPRSFEECRRTLMVTWKPLHGRSIHAIDRRTVAEHVEQIRRERGATAAARARSYLSAVYAWGMRAGLADSNPTIGTEAPAIPPSRARVLAPEELAVIWRACGDDDFGRITKLLMISGQRRTEVAGGLWSEIDVAARLWVVPGARSKNRRPHEIPLCDAALAILPERRPGRELLFGRGEQAFSGYSNAKAALDKRIAELNDKPIKSWRLHDLRHSFVTHAAELGIEPHIVEACVNHQSGHKAGIAGLYNKAVYRQQKAAAFARFADWLMAVIEGREPANNVVAFA